MKKHGMSIGIERIDSTFFLSLKAQGKLTHADYEKITPMIDSALATVENPKINILVDGTELEGWEARAAWDDFKIGLKHGGDIDKVAILGNKAWQKVIAKLGNWFVSGSVKYFDDQQEALNWLNQSIQ